jgi:hypothetical protein
MCLAQVSNMRIVISTLNGDSFELDVERTLTLSATKKLIKERLHIAQDLHVVLVGTHVLHDDRTLADYGVVEGTMLTLVIREDDLLELLQKKAMQLSTDYELGCHDVDVEAVDVAMHAQLSEGNLAEWKGEDTKTGRGWQDEYSRMPFEVSSAEKLLAEQTWLSTALGDKVKQIGCVWRASYSHRAGSKDWNHKWFVFEYDGEVFRVHDYVFVFYEEYMTELW